MINDTKKINKLLNDFNKIPDEIIKETIKEVIEEEAMQKEKLSLNEWIKIYKDLKDNVSLVKSMKPEPVIEFVDLLLLKIDQLEAQEKNIIEKLETIRNNLEENQLVGYADEIQEILQILEGEKE